jgi:hypothetical protein
MHKKIVVAWVLVIFGVCGTLDRLGYFPTAWFLNPITKLVNFFSANPILEFLYLVFPPIMLILGLVILMIERAHSEEKREPRRVRDKSSTLTEKS